MSPPYFAATYCTIFSWVVCIKSANVFDVIKDITLKFFTEPNLHGLTALVLVGMTTASTATLAITATSPTSSTCIASSHCVKECEIELKDKSTRTLFTYNVGGTPFMAVVYLKHNQLTKAKLPINLLSLMIIGKN